MKRSLFLILLLITQTLSSTEYVQCKFKNCQFGNQLFQIAAAMSLAIDNNAEAVFPELKKKKCSGFPKNYQEVFFRLNTFDPKRKKKVPQYRERSHNFQPIPYQPNLCISGYFQSEKYFCHNKEAILPYFYPNERIVHYLKEKYGKILANEKTVGMHLRSYLMYSAGLQKTLPTYNYAYYEEAMKEFPEETLFLIFSNDSKWCKKLFKNCKRRVHFVEGNDYLQDFYLLSMCEHNIISNSTFSWWAAYLNQNSNKRVIAPEYYFIPGAWQSDKDIFPDSWERIKGLKNPFL